MSQVRKYPRERRVNTFAFYRGSRIMRGAISSYVRTWLEGRLLARAFFVLFVWINVVQAEDGVSPPFAVGQEWSIRSDHPTTTKVIIDRIEAWRNKTVVHVSIVDIPSTTSKDGKAPIARIDHLPFEESALAASVDKLLSTGVAPPAYFEAGYEQWKDHSGGIYTITILELLNTVLPGEH